MSERIVAAAMQVAGLTVSLPRPAGHGEVMAQASLYREWRADGSEVQGFVTSEGRFVTRVEAMKIAHRAGQTFVTKQLGPELFSENLW